MAKWQRLGWLVLGTMVLFSATGAAQEATGSVRGVVFDKDFDAPLAAARVSIVGTEMNATTSDQGDYLITDVPTGTYTLVFSKDGYVRQVKAGVVVAAGQLVEADIWLTGDFYELDEFVVRDLLALNAGAEAALLQLRLTSPALMDSISSALMSRAGASDAAAALRLVAGATVQDGKFAVIRGLPDRYVSSKMNGVRLPTADADKRAVQLDQFPSAVIDSIQVTKTFTPDQQGDASGGAVDVRLRGIPEETTFNVRTQISDNSQVRGRDDFLTYKGGGVSFWGRNQGTRVIQQQNLGGNWVGAVGVSESAAPIAYKAQTSFGGNHEFDDGVRIGGFASFFYEQDASYYDDGIADDLWVTKPGDPLTPKAVQGSVQKNDFKTSLFDVTQGTHLVQWGSLATFGVEAEGQSLNLLYLRTHTAEDKATLAEDTRGKGYYFPGYNPDDPNDPGNDLDNRQAAPYIRLQTLEYTERTADTLQVAGEHLLPDLGFFENPVFDWNFALSSADSVQPDKRQFGSQWFAGNNSLEPRYIAFKPAATSTLGNLQRIFKEINEDSQQWSLNLKLPYEQWSGDEGYVKLGWFYDKVDRRYDQETFANFNEVGLFLADTGFDDFWSDVFPFEDHPIEESLIDVDYIGDQNISAWYAMTDLPVNDWINIVGGARVETTKLGIVNIAEADAFWFPKGANAPVTLNPGDADVNIRQKDLLPSLGVIIEPVSQVTVRGSYSKTIARPTFKELTPIIQQEFLGGPIFIGNPELGLSGVTNFDLRVDYSPYEDGIVSVSWFRKELEDAIENIQRVFPFSYTTAVNYPKGNLMGFELEGRQNLGHFWGALDGLSVGANATFIDSEVTLPLDESVFFLADNIAAPTFEREMTNAPEHLYNFYLTYDLAVTGTQVGLFYTIQGDTLISGAAVNIGNYVPSIYARQFGTLNLNLSQQLGEVFRLTVQAKNLTNPSIETIYRSPFLTGDVTNTSFTRGIDFSIALTADVRF